MQDYQKISYAPLNQEERAKLKKGYIFLPIFAVLSAIIFTVMLSFSDGDDFFFYAVCTMACFFAGIIIWIVRGIYLDLKDNEKKIIQGIITHKETVHHRNSKSGGTKWSHYFYFGKKRMKVEADLFHRFDEGDLVEIHQAKRVYNVIFKTEKLKSGMLPDEVAKQKEEIKNRDQKLSKNVIFIFIILVPVVLSGVFMIAADCFNCPPKYPSSMTAWTDYQPDMSVTDPVAKKGEEIISLMNGSLEDQEEFIIHRIFYDFNFELNTNDLIAYLDQKKINVNDTLSALDWLTWKYDEQTLVRRPVTLIEMWKRVLYNLIPAEVLRPSYTFYKNESKFEELTTMLMAEKTVSYSSIKAWFGRYSNQKDLLRATRPYIPEQAAEQSPGVQKFMREVWSGEFMLTGDRASVDLAKAKKVYQIDSE